MFKKLNSKIVYQNQWMKVYEDAIKFENGSRGIYGYVVRQNGAAVLILNQKNEVLLLKQYRYPIQAYQWGIPGGSIESDENVEAAARREVLEETGLQIAELEQLGEFFPLSSNSTEKGILFLARVGEPQLSEKFSQTDESVIEKKFIPIEDVLEMIDQNEITDAYSCNALQMLARKLKKP